MIVQISQGFLIHICLFVVAEPATLALSTLSLVTCFPGIFSGYFLKPIPKSSLLKKGFPRQRLFHPNHLLPFYKFVHTNKLYLQYDNFTMFIKCSDLIAKVISVSADKLMVIEHIDLKTYL